MLACDLVKHEVFVDRHRRLGLGRILGAAQLAPPTHALVGSGNFLGLSSRDRQGVLEAIRMKRKLTAAEKKKRRERKKKFMIIFINGKQKRVPRPTLIDGMSVDEFIRRNADPIWLHQNELWWCMPE